MKKILLFFVCATLFAKVEAQSNDTLNQTQKDSSKFIAVDKVPEFPGGLGNLMKYYNKNLKYPNVARKNHVEGLVYVSFIVERDGTLTEIKIAKSLSTETDEEALRLLANSPKWIPSSARGCAVRVKYSVPVYFKLN